MNKTIFCDIDGTLLKHHGGLYQITQSKAILLPNAIGCIKAWKDKDYRIILTTGRPESMRDLTVEQLREVGIFYDMLIMGLPRGCLLYTSPSPRDLSTSRMPSSA